MAPKKPSKITATKTPSKKRLSTNDSKISEMAKLNATLRAFLELFTQIAEHYGVPVDRAAINAVMGIHESPAPEDKEAIESEVEEDPESEVEDDNF